MRTHTFNQDRWHTANKLWLHEVGPNPRPKRSGSMNCIGQCGKTVSANTGLCAACRVLFNAEVERKRLEQEATAASPAEGTPAARTTQPPRPKAKEGGRRGAVKLAPADPTIRNPTPKNK